MGMAMRQAGRACTARHEVVQLSNSADQQRTYGTCCATIKAPRRSAREMSSPAIQIRDRLRTTITRRCAHRRCQHRPRLECGSHACLYARPMLYSSVSRFSEQASVPLAHAVAAPAREIERLGRLHHLEEHRDELACYGADRTRLGLAAAQHGVVVLAAEASSLAPATGEQKEL